MKNFSKLMALALAVLMALACLASCGETPAETTAEAAKVETTAAETTALKTKATETTTKAVTTTKVVTTVETTTAAPIPGLDDPMPAAAHTEHDWAVIPTFTAYAEKKADNTVGYYAYHCRYEGCEAIKDDKMYPTLIQMDFEGFSGSFLNYLKTGAVANAGPFNKATSNTNGNVKNGMWSNTGNGQCVFEDLSQFSTNDKFVLSCDVLTGSVLQGGGYNMLFPAFGKYSQTVPASYYYCLGVAGKGTGDNKDCLFGYCNFEATHKVDGFTIKPNQWYHLEYEITMSDEKYVGREAGAVKVDGSVAEKLQTFYRGTAVVYLTEMARNADGSMVRIGERNLVATHTGFDALEDGGKDQNYDQFLVKIYTGSGTTKQVVSAMDNFAVYLLPETK